MSQEPADDFERLLLAVAHSEVDEAWAAERTRELVSTGVVEGSDLIRGSGATVDAAQSGSWRPALRVHRLLMSGVEFLSGPEAAEARRRVVSDWVEIVRHVLMEIPDGRLLRNAVERGDQMAAESSDETLRQYRGELLFRLGILHLDPYVGGRRGGNRTAADQQWWERLRQELGPEFHKLNAEDYKLPSVGVAMETSAAYLRKAAACWEGRLRGRALKALVEALFYLRTTGELVHDEELIEAAHGALAELDQSREPQHWLFVVQVLLALRQPFDLSEVNWIVGYSGDQLVERFGPRGAVETVLLAASVLGHYAPHIALEVLVNNEQIVEKYGSENERAGALDGQFELFGHMALPDLPTARPDGNIVSIANDVLERARKEKWSRGMTAAALAAFANFTIQWRAESAGLDVLVWVEEQAPAFVARHRAACMYLKAKLLLGAAGQHVLAAEWDEAVRAYGPAVRHLLELGLPGATLDALQRIRDVAWRGGAAIADWLLLAIGPIAVRIVRLLGPAGISELKSISRIASGHFMTGSHGVDVDVLLGLFQVGKGLLFAQTLRNTPAPDRLEGDEDRELLGEIEALEGTLLEAGPSRDTRPPIDDEDFLISILGPAERALGDDRWDRLFALQRRYDGRITERLLFDAESGEPTFASLTDVQAALDERTVLVCLYVGSTGDGRHGIQVLTATQDDGRLFGIGFNAPDHLISLESHGRTALINPMTMLVRDIRLALQEDPKERPATAEAHAALMRGSREFLGSLSEHLNEFARRGKDHLCIVPHGALHYLPFHLLGPAEHPLADDWIVSYLPNLQLLLKMGARQRRPNGGGLSSIGVSFHQDPRRWLQEIEIPEAVDEAEAVAATFGANPILDSEAIREHVIGALTTSRYVHIATHGAHNPHAPSFHRIFLAQSPASPGHVDAHHLLGLDLRGLDLVTLSACETALGRFDEGDNLRGFPSMLFLAGVRSIVGTLWPVETNASQLFFTTLYRELRQEKTVLDAFATAQSETRTHFPAHRDWGPFTLVGEWA
jgi:CHAT domain